MVYVFDGYNIIHSLRFIDKAGFNMRQARESFISFVGSYLDRKKKNIQVVIVFDSLRGGGPSRVISKSKDFKIVFAKNSTADSWIRAFIRRSGRKGEVTVVSEDRKDIGGFARSMGCAVMSGSEIMKRFSKVLKLGPETGRHAAGSLDKASKSKITRELYERYINSKNDL